MTKPKVQLLLGDTAGVGPELCVKAADNLPRSADGVQLILTGNGTVLDEACRSTGIHLDLPRISSFDEVEHHDEPVMFWDYRTEDEDTIPRGRVSAEAGREVLRVLMEAVGLAKRASIDGMVFAPFNKESMHLAGAKHTSELEIFKEEFDCPEITGEINILDELWLARVTSHIAVARISESLSVPGIVRTIELLGDQQLKAGKAPKIAVAALNPHAGENGMFGDEEGRIIIPAIESAGKKHPDWIIDGPIPADTLFPRAMAEGYTGIVGMYHDQLQIAGKLIGLERGVTFHPGMAVPIATAAHGTAFDIRGTGKAKHQALKNAVELVCTMAAARMKDGGA